MKRIFITIFCALFAFGTYAQKKENILMTTTLVVSNLYRSSLTDMAKDKTVNVAPVLSQCLDTYLTFVATLDNLNNSQLNMCKETFQYDVDGWIECNQFAMDSYLAMHAVADAAYDRCMGGPPSPQN